MILTSTQETTQKTTQEKIINLIKKNPAVTQVEMDGSTLANYMKYNYKYDDSKRMVESEALRWDSDKDEWQKDLRINYIYEGKTVTTNYYKWNTKKEAYVLVPEMTVTMDNTNM